MKKFCAYSIAVLITAFCATAEAQWLVSDKSIVLTSNPNDVVKLDAGGRYAHVLRYTQSGTPRTIYQRYSYSLTNYRDDTFEELGVVGTSARFGALDSTGGATLVFPRVKTVSSYQRQYSVLAHVPQSGPAKFLDEIGELDLFSRIEATAVSSQVRVTTRGSTSIPASSSSNTFVAVTDASNNFPTRSLFNNDRFIYQGQERLLTASASDAAATGVTAVSGQLSPGMVYVRQYSYGLSEISNVAVPMRIPIDVCIVPTSSAAKSQPHDIYVTGYDGISKFSPDGTLQWKIEDQTGIITEIDHVDVVGVVARKFLGTRYQFLFISPTGVITRIAHVPIFMSGTFTYRVDSAGQISLYAPDDYPSKLFVLSTTGAFNEYQVPGTSLGYLDQWNNAFFLSKTGDETRLNVSYNLQPLHNSSITVKRGTNVKVYLDLRTGAPRQERQATIANTGGTMFTTPAVAEFNPAGTETYFRVTAPASGTTGSGWVYISYAGRSLKLRVTVTP